MDNQSRIAAAYEYNRGMRDGLQLVYDNLNNGQKKKLLKVDDVRRMFEKFHVRIDEEAAK